MVYEFESEARLRIQLQMLYIIYMKYINMKKSEMKIFQSVSRSLGTNECLTKKIENNHKKIPGDLSNRLKCFAKEYEKSS